MKTDLFTFSIQEAETLGIECAIVLAASKDLMNSPAMPNEIALLIKEKIPFLEEQEILSHLKRLIDLKLISSDISPRLSETSAKKNLYKLKLPTKNTNAGKRKLDYSWAPSVHVRALAEYDARTRGVTDKLQGMERAGAEP